MADRSNAENDLDPLLDAVQLDTSAKRDLCTRMGGPDRFYHGAGHLALLWRRHQHYAAAAGLKRPDIDRLVASAILYHDAVYVSGRGDNEERSAELWLEASTLSASDYERTWVADTIRATKDHLAYAVDVADVGDELPIEWRARFWVLDLDLSPLGELPAIFDANVELLRAESTSSHARFERSRLSFLEQLDASPRIYRSPVLAAIFEEKARANVRRHLARLREA